MNTEALHTYFSTLLAARPLWRPRGAMILAVSGGADSMAMLHLVANLADRPKNLRVLHIHHGLRGRSADADARLVERNAKQLDLPFHLIRTNVRAITRNKKVSIEMAARSARHDAFRALAAKYRAVVATAHTRDDQAETILLRLLRGSGTDGLGGIEAKTRLNGFTLVRPMLEISREENVAFLRSQKVTWREDATNADPAMLRNRVRHELLPLLEARFSPRIRELLARTASVVRTDSSLLVQLAAGELATRTEPHGALLTSAPPHPALWHRVIYSWLLKRARIEPARLDNDLVLRVETLAACGGRITLPGGRELIARDGLLLLERPPRRRQR